MNATEVRREVKETIGKYKSYKRKINKFCKGEVICLQYEKGIVDLIDYTLAEIKEDCKESGNLEKFEMFFKYYFDGRSLKSICYDYMVVSESSISRPVNGVATKFVELIHELQEAIHKTA